MTPPVTESADFTVAASHETASVVRVASATPVVVTCDATARGDIAVEQVGYGRAQIVGAAGVGIVPPPGYVAQTRLPGDRITLDWIREDRVALRGDLMPDDIMAESLFRMSAKHNVAHKGSDRILEWTCSQGTGGRFRTADAVNMPRSDGSPALADALRMYDTGIFFDLEAQGAIADISLPASFLICCEQQASSGGRVLSDDNGYVELLNYSSADHVRIYRGGAVKDSASPASIYPVGTPLVVGAVFDGTSSSYIWFKGANIKSGDPGSADIANLKLTSKVGRDFRYETVAWDRALTETEMAAAEAIVGGDWGVAIN